MKKLVECAKRFWKEEDGLETVEYAVMAALILVAVVASVAALSGAISDRMDATTTTIGGTP